MRTLIDKKELLTSHELIFTAVVIIGANLGWFIVLTWLIWGLK